METATPMLRQYQQIKSRHQDCILFFRLGDFYEMFFEDAQVASKILDLVLTSRGKGTANQMPMCGLPYHAADNYIAKLIKAGKKVAICEQIEDPAAAKGIVKRDVIRIITSGTYLDEQSTDARYILCLCAENTPKNLKNQPSPKEQARQIGIAFIDPASGTIQANQYRNINQALEIISRLPVMECVFPLEQERAIKGLLSHPLFKNKDLTLSPHDDWCFNADIAHKGLREHFRTANLRGFGVEDLPLAVASAGALLEYLRQMNKQPLRHIDRLSLYADSQYAYVSPAAVYGLELEQLFKTINQTQTAMGKRLLRYRLYHPLKKPSAILQRQAAVTLLKNHPEAGQTLRNILKGVPDLEKSLSRLSCGYTKPRDLLAVRNALCLLPRIQETLSAIKGKNRIFMVEDLPDLRQQLERAIDPDMPPANSEGKVIRPGFHPGLDELRGLQDSGRQWLKDFQERETRRTGISSLKVGYNKVFGYYIEITKAHLSSVPEDFIRKQTLVNAERFITPELKDHEEKILSSQDNVIRIEAEILRGLQREILDQSPKLHAFCRSVADLDMIGSLGVLAGRPGWCAPEINEGMALDIKAGRHPVVEETLSETFVPNDTYLDSEEDHLIILTGPNMAGKSTYIRQIAVLVILAQMGGYLPAASAEIGVVDKIFTRIGAHDDISKGQSTFMVEMTEAADIVNNLTDRSLVILDEIGRGTSTYDGLSLAWALAEHLQNSRTRTLFATHFHELTALAEEHSGVKNYNVAVKEWKDEIIFLHKIIPGSTDDSYGIYVAKLAGIPGPVISRAKKVLTQLELSSNLKERLRGRSVPADDQLTLFSSGPDTIMKDIRDTLAALDIDRLTPVEALNRLQNLKTKLDNSNKMEKT